ncbi:LysR family transcriptional regulator [Achromobacter xylosoxidans]|uniref:LysR family transcriptional regulator n=1 Tax=Achromobacter spanius TaxID=217203 RepID=A0AA42LL57_9BURK|nr:LysR family transcriptional regulator [Achromobacter spanius]MDH0734806.1 LysR family transcriptional regulator [Achromobacter spanius]
MDRLRDMALFAEVARAGSFTKASESTGIPTSTLSRRITEFEENIRVKLFNRTTRRLDLTEVGARYLQQIDDFLQMAHTVNEALDSENSEASGQLKISMPGDFAAYFAESLFAPLRSAHPKLTFDISLSSVLPDLLATRYDASILIGDPPPSSRLIARRVTMLHWRLYATPDYLAHNGTPERPSDLESHTCLLSPISDPAQGWLLKNGAETTSIRPAPLVETNSRAVIRDLVMQDMGIGPIGQTQADALEQSGRIQRVLPGWELEPQPLYVLTTTRLLPARVRVFVDFITEWFDAMNKSNELNRGKAVN